MIYKSRLKDKYYNEIIPTLKEKYNLKNKFQIPKIEKICINQGIGHAMQDKKLIDNLLNEMSIICGQKAVTTKSKKDISNFKLRKNMPVGIRVTLIDNLMYEFLDRLISIALPRIRDFRGINASGFDKYGNFTFGVSEQIIFPEINMDKINKINGFDITFVISNNNSELSRSLLEEFGFPFNK